MNLVVSIMDNKQRIENRAEAMWNKMNKNQRFGVRMGLFPAQMMSTLRSEGFSKEDEHEIVVQLMRKR